MVIQNKDRQWVRRILRIIKDKNRVYVNAEEFSGQLGEFCVGISDYVSTELGLSCKELRNKMEEGEFMKADLFRIMEDFDKALKVV